MADATEGGGTGTFRFSRTGSTASDLMFTVEMSGTTTSMSDYGIVGPSVTIPAGYTSVDVTVTATDDGTSEPTETVVASITASMGAPHYALGTAAATVNILDNDAQEVTVEKVNDAVEDGTDGVFLFTRIGDLSSDNRSRAGVADSVVCQ